MTDKRLEYAILILQLVKLSKEIKEIKERESKND